MTKLKSPESKAAKGLDLKKAELKSIAPEKIEFDPGNPRFGKGTRSTVSQETLYKELLQDPHNATALVDSFVENGFIAYEPLIVRPKGDDEFIVIEGNRRLAAVMYIRKHPDKYGAEIISRLDEIPALVFPAHAPETDIRTYLGIRHLMGFREWPALSKAIFLDKEAVGTGDLGKLLRDISLSKSEVRRFLVPYRLFCEINQKLPDGENFWIFAEAITRAGVKQFIQLDVDPVNLKITSFSKKHLEELLDMLYGPEEAAGGKRDATKKFVEETRDLTKLGKVLASEIAITQLRKRKNLDEAFLYIDSKAELIDKFEKQISQLKVFIDRLKSSMVLQERKDLESAVSELDRAFKRFKGRKHD